jgi:uncharacterized membrane protein YoaK (UPF0700 family)
VVEIVDALVEGTCFFERAQLSRHAGACDWPIGSGWLYICPCFRSDRAVTERLPQKRGTNERPELMVAVCLGLIAGYVDACGIRAFGAYVSFMSGNTTQTGVMTGQGQVAGALPFAVAIVSFVGGSFGGTWITQSRLREPRALLFGATAVLLAATFVAMQAGPLDAQFAIAILSFAMGAMNCTVSQIGSERVGLTFVTGNLSRVGRHLALAARHAPLEGTEGPHDTHRRRALIPASIWTAFLIGAALGGAAIALSERWMLMPPVLALVTLALFVRPRSGTRR